MQKTFCQQSIRQHQPGQLMRNRHTHVGVCKGALGELFQGPSTHTENEIVVVSSLIAKYSWAYFIPDVDNHNSYPNRASLLARSDRRKSFKALDLYCQLNQLPWPQGQWRFKSDLKVARGMASSTADIVSILRCAASYFGNPLGNDEIIRILAEIERSDSVFLDRLALFCSSRHQIINQFDKMPPLYALYMHETNTVETEGTRQTLVDYYRQNRTHYSQLYNRMANALGSQDLRQICQVSTKSAELSQEILPKQHFYSLLNEMSRFDADGIITAHTGSVVGLLFCRPPEISCLEQVGRFFNQLGGDCLYTEIGS
jgi:uncharacterized protein involved in propanediol utilization